MTSLPGPKNVSTTSTPAEVREGSFNKVESIWRGTTFLRNWAFTKQKLVGWFVAVERDNAHLNKNMYMFRNAKETKDSLENLGENQLLYQLGLWVLAHGSSEKSYLQPMGFHFWPKWRVSMPRPRVHWEVSLPWYVWSPILPWCWSVATWMTWWRNVGIRSSRLLVVPDVLLILFDGSENPANQLRKR